jgi:hypothetical protein
MTGERILGYFVESHLKAAGIPISLKSAAVDGVTKLECCGDSELWYIFINLGDARNSMMEPMPPSIRKVNGHVIYEYRMLGLIMKLVIHVYIIGHKL